jgi:hypothetical protein
MHLTKPSILIYKLTVALTMKSPISSIRIITLFLLMLSVTSTVSNAQETKIPDGTFTTLAHLPDVLRESSDIMVTKNGTLWTIVDSKLPFLYNISETGEVKRVVNLNHKNLDWEDVAQDDDGNVYVGNFGNNGNKRKDLRIIKLPCPDSLKSDTIYNGGMIHFTYPDQKAYPPARAQMNFDMEAMITFNNSIYLFSKNRTSPFTGYTKVYKLPTKPGKYVAELIDSVNLGPGKMLDTWVTSADISPDKKIVALLTHDKVWLFYCFKGDKFFSGKMKTIPLNNFSQKEGICFINNTEFYITDELYKDILGGNLYKLTLNKDYGAECK